TSVEAPRGVSTKLLPVSCEPRRRIVLGIDRQRDHAYFAAIRAQSVAQDREGLTHHRTHGDTTRINEIQIGRTGALQLSAEINFRAIVPLQDDALNAWLNDRAF